ncbi:MAG TPA: hypothetical protein PK735_12460 [Flavobacteriales bacterium]|nr:hypothetical protein [Flavobacteriales bacterium]
MTDIERVELEWAMPDLTEVSQMDPFSAFEAFVNYYRRAFDEEYLIAMTKAKMLVAREEGVRAMNKLDPDRLHTNTENAKYEVVNGMGSIYPMHTENAHLLVQIEWNFLLRVKDEMADAIAPRIVALLPAIQSYVKSHVNDPITITRLSAFVVSLREIESHIQDPFAFPMMKGWKLHYTVKQIRYEFYKDLVKIAESFRVSAGSSASTSPNENSNAPIQWKGKPAELYVLFDELLGKGWVELPKKRGKRSRIELAHRIHEVFGFANGIGIAQSTAENYLKKGSKGYNEQRPEPRVPFLLNWNPDVGKGYDPDNSGE